MSGRRSAQEPAASCFVFVVVTTIVIAAIGCAIGLLSFLGVALAVVAIRGGHKVASVVLAVLSIAVAILIWPIYVQQIGLDGVLDGVSICSPPEILRHHGFGGRCG